MMRTTKDESIIQWIQRSGPNGSSIEELVNHLAIPRRTIQRSLTRLVQEGHLVAVGKARSRRYHIPERESRKLAGGIPIPLTPEGRQIQEVVSQPIQQRHPVGYHREFLDSYIPNQTYFLSETLRKKLRLFGERNEEECPTGTYARQIIQRLLIDLSWNSSRLEGNTYSLLETKRLLELGEVAAGKNLNETQMILNHKAAIEFLISSAEEIGINRYTILNLHSILSDNLMSDPESCGRLRLHSVGIERSVYVPMAIPQMIEECFDQLIARAQRIRDPYEQAFFLLVQLPYLQAFDDVNKRTSRLAANIPLIINNLCPISFVDVPQELYVDGLLGVYELNRVELLRDLFAWAYERSCLQYSVIRKAHGEPDPIQLRYRSGIQQLIQKIVQEQVNDKAFVHQWANEHVNESDRKHFIEIVNRELLRLNEGNIARYHIRLSEYAAWKRGTG